MLIRTVLLLLCLLMVVSADAYSVMSHIAIVDDSWDGLLVPVLKKRFPAATEEEIQEARKFAYGGCIIQDLGYYPGGSKLFSDLLHYVRSGDFIDALLRNSNNPSEYAFALAALAHYVSDNQGHALATNRAVPMLYPDLRRKYGTEVTFDDKPSAHLKVEFGYDVLQVARGNYLSDDYHDFIGFDVAKELLEKSFREIYGLHVEDVIADFDTAIGSYRYAVTGLIPDAIKVAWELKKDEIEEMSKNRNRPSFRMTRGEFENKYGKKYLRPSIFSKILAFFIKILPPIGPLKVLKFKPPTPEVEAIFLKSFDTSLEHYTDLVNRMDAPLANRNLDTGAATSAGEYRRTDATYRKWLETLSEKNFAMVDASIEQNILAYYRNPSALKESEKEDWADIEKELQKLGGRN